MDQKISYIISMGNICDGFTFYGPFDDPNAAVDWASENDGGEPWEICKVHEALPELPIESEIR